MWARVLVLFFALTAVIATKKSYEGYKLYKVNPKNNEQLQALSDLKRNGVEFWSEHYEVNQDIRIMVSSEEQTAFKDMLENVGMGSEIIFDDLQKVIDNQLKPDLMNHPKSTRNRESLYSMTWDRYYDLNEIYAWLDELAAAYPNIVRTVVMGTSFEGREIKGIVINYNPGRNDTKIGMLEGTMHAREWISTATLTWIIKEFLTSTNWDVRAMAENIEWHIFPVVNPDGYSYTFTHNRMWRKNRSTQSFVSCASSGVDHDMSNGVDLNRNFDFAWMSVGASDNSCTNTYAGPGAFSEPETRAIAQYARNINERGEFIYYIAFHSYTQLIIIPYSNVTGGTDVLQSGNFADMYEVAIRGAEKLRQRHNTNYRVGVSAEVMYPMSGTSFDWAKAALNVPIAYLIELRDLGEYGFLLPAEQIIPSNLEIMDALIEMDKTVRDLGYYSSGVGSVTANVTLLFGIIALFASLL